MPTVILLDVSLSMFRPIPSPDGSESHTRFTLACAAINSFLDYLNLHVKLEYVALVTFSSSYEVTVPFTRDFDTIRSGLLLSEEGDKTCLETALLGVSQLVLSEWGHQTPVNVVLVTDGCVGTGPIGRARSIASLAPPSCPCRPLLLPLAAPHDHKLQHAMPLYQKIIELASSGPNGNGVSRGAIYCPDSLSVAGVTTAMSRLTEQQYAPVQTTIKCGQLEARVQLFPAPSPSPSPPLTVMGFLPHAQLGTPITQSTHLIIPLPSSPSSRDNYDTKSKDSSSMETDDDASDPSRTPNFCVLLHGALKVENMAAIVQLSEDVYGTITAWCVFSRARRSCLLLSIMKGARTSAPWLGSLDRLGPEVQGPEGQPVKAVRSYSSGAMSGGGAGGAGAGAAWARPHALLADVQKVLRHARKLPEKTQHLYKELNRLRRVAISLGFSELLTSLALALERECSGGGGSGGAGGGEAALQLAHAARALRDPRTRLDAQRTITPLEYGSGS